MMKLQMNWWEVFLRMLATKLNILSFIAHIGGFPGKVISKIMLQSSTNLLSNLKIMHTFGFEHALTIHMTQWHTSGRIHSQFGRANKGIFVTKNQRLRLFRNFGPFTPEILRQCPCQYWVQIVLAKLQLWLIMYLYFHEMTFLLASVFVFVFLLLVEG